MRKRLVLLLLMKLSGLLPHSAEAQSSLSLEHYYTMRAASPMSIMPVASFQTGNGFYAEGRYNYEALNTFSLYMGRTFSGASGLSYSISPIAGAVVGEFNGGSVGANVSLGYKNFYLYTQPQYSFSVENAINNFIYSWTDITYSPLNWLSVGVSLQHTKPYKTKGYIENGLVVEAAYKKFTFPVYIYSPHNNNRSILFGANLELNFRKSKASKSKAEDSFKDVYPVDIIANVPKRDQKAIVTPTSSAAKAPTESVVRVRRVNVVVQAKTTSTNNAGEESKRANAVLNVNSNALKADVAPLKPQIKPESGNKTATLAKAFESPKEVVKEAPKAAEAISSERADKAVSPQPSAPAIYFALLLGPFKNEEEAMNNKWKLEAAFNREVILFSEGAKYKLRIPGFYDQKTAEMFSLNASNEGCMAAATIISYKLKTIDAIPLKSASKPFEATKL